MLHTALQVFLGIAQFVVVVLASVVIGFVVGMIAAFITRFSEHVHGEYLPHLSKVAKKRIILLLHELLLMLDFFLLHFCCSVGAHYCFHYGVSVIHSS